MRRVRGFSLLELIIVMLIIGVLAAMSIPRFMIFRSRTLQTEMKTNLASLMRSEKAYLSENHSYTDDLARIAWTPDGAPVYLYGFTSDALPAASGRNDTAELRAASGGPYRTTRMVDAFGNVLSEGDLPPSIVQENSLTAGAVGNIDQDDTLDSWTLDGDGNLVNVMSDIDN
ncbi:MAG: prepilin-type N-terminal cleavage/methylation domain-containing protein [Myxococcota bacterium]